MNKERRVCYMQNLTELEVENLRHLIGGHATIINKLDQYAQACTDPQLKQMLQKMRKMHEIRNSN